MKSSILQRLLGYQTLLDAVAGAPADRRWLVSYQPHKEEPFREMSFGEFAELTGRCRGLLSSEGLVAGDTVAMMLPQEPLVMALFVASMQLGAVPTILAYPTFKVEPEKYRHGLVGVTGTIRPRLVLVDNSYPSELCDVIPATVVVVDEATLPVATPVASEQTTGKDVAFLQHSAGTTGLQKGVALPHSAVLNQLARLVEVLGIRSDDRIVSWLPLYHDMGLVACFILPLVCHLPVVMMSPTDWILHPETFLELATRYRATLGWLPNFAFQFMARRVSEEARRDLDLGSMRVLVSASEPIRGVSLDEFKDVFTSRGLRPEALQTSYAMAENTFAVTQSPVDGRTLPARTAVSRVALFEQGRVVEAENREDRVELVSCGQPLPGCEVRIVDLTTGRALADGAVGELLVRSDCLFDGYFRRPELSERALQDGWYRSGDLAFRQAQEVYVLGRRDDVIIVAGRNVFPEDAEVAAARHPEVRDGRVVAFGVENPKLGTRDLVVIAEARTGLDRKEAAAIADWIRQEVAAELTIAPNTVHVVEPGWIVKSTAGKPARSTNRKKFLKQGWP